jgi:uncharacterized hydrophobic protein (TIGR00271 family)
MKTGYKTLADLTPSKDKTVAIIISQQEAFSGLLTAGYKTAEIQKAYLVIFITADALNSLHIPEEYDSVRIVIECFSDISSVGSILKQIKRFRPILLGLQMNTDIQDTRYLAGKDLNIIIQKAPCPIYVIKSPSGWSISNDLKVLVPFWDDANTHFAIDTLFALNPNLQITACIVVPPSAALADVSIQGEEFSLQTSKWHKEKGFTYKILRGYEENQAFLEEVKKHDCLLLGASRGNRIARTLFGDIRNKIVNQVEGPAIILREYQGRAGVTMSSAWTVFDRLLPTLTKEDRIEAYRQIRRGGRPNRDFVTMIVLSAAIASLGLILDSAAVIIGAMLVAPLMSAVIGMGMAIIHGDLKFLKIMTTAVLKGAFLAILTGFILGLINFREVATAQLLQRTSPLVLDLVVAIVSGVAGAYALCRKNVSNSLPGVAIAVALIPPLTTFGVCLSMGSWSLSFGALKLFLSNIVGIVFASALVFASFGFKPNLDNTKDQRRITVFQRSIITSATLVAVMLLLLVTRTVKEVREANFEDEVQEELTTYLTDLKLAASVDHWSMTAASSGTTKLDLRLEVTRQLSAAEVESLRKRMEQTLGTPVSLDLELIPITRMSSQ